MHFLAYEKVESFLGNSVSLVLKVDCRGGLSDVLTQNERFAVRLLHYYHLSLLLRLLTLPLNAILERAKRL